MMNTDVAIGHTINQRRTPCSDMSLEFLSTLFAGIAGPSLIRKPVLAYFDMITVIPISVKLKNLVIMPRIYRKRKPRYIQSSRRANVLAGLMPGLYALGRRG